MRRGTGESGTSRGRRRLLAAALAVLLVSLAASCSSDGSGAAPGRHTIGFLRAVRSPEPENQRVFLETLAEAGFVAGENLTVHGLDPGDVHADPEEAQAEVARWREGRLDLVVALSSSSARAAAAVSGRTPVLFLSNDPRATGLVADERRPGGQLTGVTFRVPADRTLDLARQAMPGLRRVGFLYPADDPTALPARDATIDAGPQLGIELLAASFRSDADIAAEIQRLRRDGVQCLLLGNAPATVRSFPAIAAAAEAARLPVVTNVVADFALLVLEPDTQELYRQMGRQAIRLLRGAAVADVPVEDPARYRSIVNTGVAGRLGLTLPESVLRGADRVVG